MDRTETMRPAAVSEGASVAKRRLLSRLSFGHVVMICAGLLAFLLNVLIVRDRGETVEVPVATRPIPAGSRLVARDIGFARVDAAGPFVDRVLSRDGITPFLGDVVVRDIGSGDPLMSADLRPVSAAGGGRAMSIPIAPDYAVGAALHVGDRVDVIAVDRGESSFVADGIEVLHVTHRDSRPVGDRFAVTVAVTQAEALAIAGALDRGPVHLLRSTGAGDQEPRDGALESGL